MTPTPHTISRRAFLGLQASLVAGALAGCAIGNKQDEGKTPANPDAPRSLEEIRASGHLNVGIYSDSKPLGYIGKYGNYNGYDGYFCLYITERAGLPVTYVPVDPCNRYEALLTNAVDVCLAEMSPSDDVEGVLYANPLLKLQLGLISSKDAPISSPDDLGDGELIVCSGSYAEQYATKNWPQAKLRTYDTITDTYVALRNGKGVALLDDEVCALAWLNDKKTFVLSMEAIGEPRLVGPAVAAGQNELAELMSGVVADFISSSFDTDDYDSYIKSSIGGRDLTRILCDGTEVTS